MQLELDHSYPADLSVELCSPNGTKETLLSPGRNEEKAECFCLPVNKIELFENTGTKGEWSLTLIDSGMKDQGHLISWSLDFEVEAKERDILIEDQSILELNTVCSLEGKISVVDLELNIKHNHIGDLKISLMSPDGRLFPPCVRLLEVEYKLFLLLNHFLIQFQEYF